MLVDRDGSLTSCGSPGARSWQQLVVEFRALRESLTSIHSHDAASNLLAYELAAQVCLHAGDYSEYLKTAQALVQEKFPSAVVSDTFFLSVRAEVALGVQTNLRRSNPTLFFLFASREVEI